jgi:predicted NUDIX family NTP pyrophosphohydrolase
MPKTSAGIAVFRRTAEGGHIEVLLVHPGGPYWRNKDEGAWSFPKGEFDPASEDPLLVARRELYEETGCEPAGEFLPLGTVTQAGGKVVHLWAVRGDCDVSSVKSNTFTVEWPPRSGRRQEFPEVDRAGWFPVQQARRKLLEGQRPFLDLLDELANE